MTFLANPDLPFAARIHEGVKDGRVVTIKGKSVGNEIFSLNIKEKDDHGLDGNNVGCHVAMRFPHHEVALNSLIHGSWKTEHRAKLPVSAGEDFKVIIKISSNDYNVSINDTDVGTLIAPIPIDQCEVLFLNGPVNIHSIKYSGPDIRKSSTDEKAEEIADDMKELRADKGEDGEKKKKDKKDKKEKHGKEGEDGEKKKKKKKEKKEGDEDKDEGNESDASSSSSSSSSSDEDKKKDDD